MAVKLSAVLAAVTPFLAADKTPDEVKTALLAIDKKAKDAAGSGLGPKELEEKDQAKDKGAKDRDDDPEHTNDAKDKGAKDKKAKDSEEEMEAKDEDYMEGSDPSTPGGSRAKGKTAIDSADVDRRISEAVKASNIARDALHVALREVEPILGVVTFDSAADAYSAALKALNIDTAGVDKSAYPALLKIAKDRARDAAPIAMDSNAQVAAAKLIPTLNRLK